MPAWNNTKNVMWQFTILNQHRSPFDNRIFSYPCLHIFLATHLIPSALVLIYHPLWKITLWLMSHTKCNVHVKTSFFHISRFPISFEARIGMTTLTPVYVWGDKYWHNRMSIIEATLRENLLIKLYLSWH